MTAPTDLQLAVIGAMREMEPIASTAHDIALHLWRDRPFGAGAVGAALAGLRNRRIINAWRAPVPGQTTRVPGYLVGLHTSSLVERPVSKLYWFFVKDGTTAWAFVKELRRTHPSWRPR